MTRVCLIIVLSELQKAEQGSALLQQYAPAYSPPDKNKVIQPGSTWRGALNFDEYWATYWQEMVSGTAHQRG